PDCADLEDRLFGHRVPCGHREIVRRPSRDAVPAAVMKRHEAGAAPDAADPGRGAQLPAGGFRADDVTLLDTEPAGILGVELDPDIGCRRRQLWCPAGLGAGV